MNARHRLLGLAFVAVLGASLCLAVLQYRQAFADVTWVTLRTSRTGMQLRPGAEVKLHGVVVGEVRTVGSDGTGARLRLALDPSLVSQIPADVNAQLLPKTLFGERYVALVPPAPVTGRAIRAGDVIAQDRSESGVELERVLDNALPLLQAIQPDKLAATLGALATALDGKGDEFGEQLVTLDGYLAALNEQMPVIAEDVRRLAKVLDVYDGAMPDLLAILRDASVTARTVTDQRTQLATLFADSTDAADATRFFLERHGDQLIQVGDVSRPVLELLAAYAPEYPCLLRGVVALQPRVEQVFSTGRMRITLEVTRDNGKFVPHQDEPAYGAKNGPDCQGLPDPPAPAPSVPIDDGYDYGASRPGPAKQPVGLGRSAGENRSVPGPASLPTADAGTAEERKLLEPLLGATMGMPPAEVPDIAVLLWGPLLRGAVVNAP
jgi:phospholipid/cholesterol/gamma-HCH transport system substrate-binding protein